MNLVDEDHGAGAVALPRGRGVHHHLLDVLDARQHGAERDVAAPPWPARSPAPASSCPCRADPRGSPTAGRPGRWPRAAVVRARAGAPGRQSRRWSAAASDRRAARGPGARLAASVTRRVRRAEQRRLAHDPTPDARFPIPDCPSSLSRDLEEHEAGRDADVERLDRGCMGIRIRRSAMAITSSGRPRAFGSGADGERPVEVGLIEVDVAVGGERNQAEPCALQHAQARPAGRRRARQAGGANSPSRRATPSTRTDGPCHRWRRSLWRRRLRCCGSASRRCRDPGCRRPRSGASATSASTATRPASRASRGRGCRQACVSGWPRRARPA